MDAVSNIPLTKDDLSSIDRLNTVLSAVVDDPKFDQHGPEAPYFRAQAIRDEIAALAPDGWEYTVYPVKNSFGFILRKARR